MTLWTVDWECDVGQGHGGDGARALAAIFCASLFLPAVALAQAEGTAPLSLDAIASTLRARLFEVRREALQREDLELQKQLFEKDRDARFSLRNQVGARIVPKEKGAAEGTFSGVALWPRKFDFTQTHSFEASKTLYDFGRHEANRRALNAQEKVIGFDGRKAEEQVRWQAASLLLGLRNAVGVVHTLDAQLANANKKRSMIESNYAQGLRSVTDRTRAEADVLRVQLRREQALQAVREQSIALASRLGDVRSSALEAAALADKRPAIRERTEAEWRALFDAAGVASQSSPPSESALPGPAAETVADGSQNSSGAPAMTTTASELPPGALIEVERIAAQKNVLREQVNALDSQDAPTIVGAVGTQWPGELFPVRGSLYGTLTFAWDIPWNGKTDTDKARALTQMSLLELEADAVRQDALETVRAAWPARDALLGELALLVRQRATLLRLREQTELRYANGRATSLELSQLEDEFLAVITESTRLQGRLASALLAFAIARGNEALARTLVE